MMSIEEIKALLADRRPAIVAEKTGLSQPTIRAAREGRDVSMSTLRKLSEYFSDQTQQK